MPRRAGPDTKQERIIEALQKSGGNIAAAARSLNWNRSALSRRISASPVLREILDDERETVVDIAETQLRKSLHDGDSWAVMYTLNNSPAAKRRGWGPRQEVTGAEGGPLQVQQVFDHERVVTAIEARSSRYRLPSGADEDDSNGA